MSTDKPIITKAVVELTFANGITRRIILDDKDLPIEFDLSTATDGHEGADETGTVRTVQAGDRRSVDVHLSGRGPLQIDIPAAAPEAAK